MRYFRFILILLLLGLLGCDFLKYDETTNYKEDDVFTYVVRTRQFLSNIYSHFRPGGFNSIDGAMRASASDNAEEINNLSNVQAFNDGSWSAINTLDSKWDVSPDGFYYGIRAANLFLKKFDINNYSDIQYNNDYDQLMERAREYPYEARFLRAFFYFKLLKRYGHVPLITSVMDASEANSVKPSSYEEVTKFIVDECDAIIPNLPVDYHNLPYQWTGRATRGAAMALKARALLYAASPLHNPSNDKQKWVSAAKAAKAIIDSSYYSLENNYSDIFNNLHSNELIWERRHGESNDFEQANFPIGYEGSKPMGTAPTQNLVDAYEMQSTGESIDTPGSGYDPNNPYDGRDPRLKETILVNNSTWKGRKVELWKGGKDGLPQPGASETGYYLKKYVIEGTDIAPPNTTTRVHSWVVFRYGGILLDYAEAMNEAYGPEDPGGMGMTARQAVDLVRERSNMPDFPSGMTQDAFRTKLHNERRVEMAFENQRFWDIRRWKIGPSTKDIYGMDITRNNDGTFNYQKKLVEHRVWDKKMYLYPIPQSELAKNSALQQNPGW